MKKSIYCFIFLGLVFFSCKKEKNKSNACNGSLLAYKGVTDSTSKLISIDATTGKIIDNLSNFAINNYTSSDGTYNINDNYYYIFQDVVGKMQLLRYNLNSKGTDILTYTGIFNISNIHNIVLLYNSVVNKIYCIYYNVGGDKVYELIIKGNKCSEKEVFTTTAGYSISSPVIDENTGNFYFIFREGGTSKKYLKMFSPVSSVVSVIAPIDSVGNLQFSKNDNMLYGIKEHYDAASSHIRHDFIRIDPTNGTVSTIATIFANSSISIYILYSGFDKCNNMFMIDKRNALSSYDKGIYWLDLTSGNTVKHLTPTEDYWGLTYIQIQ